MKKLLTVIMVFGSLSVFANPCDESVKSLISASTSLGAIDSLHMVNNVNATKFQTYKDLFQEYPNRVEIGGYSRETLEEEIQSTKESIENLEEMAINSKRLIKLHTDEIKENCK